MTKPVVNISRVPLSGTINDRHIIGAILSRTTTHKQKIRGSAAADEKLLCLLQEHCYLLAVNKGAPQISDFHAMLNHPSIQELYDKMLTGERASLDFTQNYAPAVLLNYFASGIFNIEFALDLDTASGSMTGLKLDVRDDVHGHACTGEYLLGCLGSGILRMVPQDAAGAVYAINPLFELSKEEVITLITSKTFNLNDYVKYMVNIIVTRLTTAGVDIPIAHNDYQHPEVVQLGGLNYQSGQAECAKCGQIFAEIKKWTLREDKITAEPIFHTTCPAANSPLIPKFKSARAFSVEVPTGDLFFADWLRDEEGFGVRLFKNHNYDINTLHGRMQASAYFASKNVIHGSTDNGSCFLISNLDGTVLYIVGNYNDKKLDKLGLRYVGGISTDLWGYTMMDRAHLEPLSSPAHQCMLQDLIHPVSSHQWEVPGMLQVKPGNYFHFYFNSYGRDIDKMLAQLPTDVQDTVKALKVSALHGVLIHKELIA